MVQKLSLLLLSSVVLTACEDKYFVPINKRLISCIPYIDTYTTNPEYEFNIKPGINCQLRHPYPNEQIALDKIKEEN